MSTITLFKLKKIFLAELCSTWDLSFLTSDQTHAPCIESTEKEMVTLSSTLAWPGGLQSVRSQRVEND